MLEMPIRSRPADPEEGDWECSLPGPGSDLCPYPGADCTECAWMSVNGDPDINRPAAPPSKASGGGGGAG